MPTTPETGKVYQMVVTRKGVSNKGGFTTGFILLKSQPPGAKVYIDGEYRGITPFQQEMAGGYYTYRVEKEMFYPKKGNFIISGNLTTTEEIILEKSFGSLVVTTTPISGAQITIDGVTTNFKTTYTFDTLSTGSHTVQILIDLHEPITKEVIIKDKKSTNLEIPLSLVHRYIEISSFPPAEIYIDKVFKGTGNYSGILTKGIHTVEAKLDKHYSQSRKLDMKAGMKEIVQFELEPIVGSLSILTEPPEAQILIEGKSYGRTPIIINDLIIGTYNIEIMKEHFATITIQTEITENSRSEIIENLSNYKEIIIWSQPQGASLVLNGMNKGTTPKTLTTSFGENKIKLSNEGYLDYSETFKVTEQKYKYEFVMTSNKKAMAQIDFKKYKIRKNIWLGGTIISAGVGGYFLYSANKHYDEYQTATENATDLHNQIKTEDIIWPIAFGVSGVCGIVTIVNAAKQGKARKQINLSVVPVEGGGMISICLTP